MQPSVFIPVFIPLIFLGIALVFFVLSLRDVVRGKGEQSISGKIRLKMALIFSAVGIGLYFVLNSVGSLGLSW